MLKISSIRGIDQKLEVLVKLFVGEDKFVGGDSLSGARVYR